MSSRKIMMLLAALLIAVGAIVLARQALKPAADENGVPVVEEHKRPQVLVAARDLAAGSLLRESDMKWQAWSEEPKEHMLIKEQTNVDDYVGALSRGALRAGEPIMGNRVFRTHEQGFLSAALSPGMRAISLKITPVSGLAGLIFPGDHVDVIVAHNVPVPGTDGQNRDRRVSETIVVNARVLALDQKTDEKVTEPKIADVATLEVNPKDAEKIALIADWNSTVSLVLRSLTDNLAETEAAKAAAAMPPKEEKPVGHDEVPDEEPLAATPGIALSPNAKASVKPPAKAQHEPRASFTWDSDVSRVLARPDSATNASRRIQVIRGKDSSEISFQQ